MEREKILERIASLEKGVAAIDGQVKDMTDKIAQLSQSKVVTLGAIADCKHWLAILDEDKAEENSED